MQSWRKNNEAQCKHDRQLLESLRSKRAHRHSGQRRQQEQIRCFVWLILLCRTRKNGDGIGGLFYHEGQECGPLAVPNPELMGYNSGEIAS